KQADEQRDEAVRKRKRADAQREEAEQQHLQERRRREEAEEREGELEREIETVSKDSPCLRTKAQQVRQFVETMDRPMSAGEIAHGAGVARPVNYILKQLVAEAVLERQGNPNRPHYRKKG